MILIDTHCHVNFKEFKTDANEVINRSLSQGTSLIVVGSQKDTSERAIEYAEQHDGVYAAVGLHPVHLFSYEVETDRESFVSRAEEFDYEYYKKLATHEKVVALGEMGLDYYRLTEIIKSSSYAKASADKQKSQKQITIEDIKKQQQEAFMQGLKLAKELDKPMIIHTRQEDTSQKVYEDVLELIKQSEYNKCVVHCYSGNLSEAQAFIELGCKISFTGIVTFKNAREMQAVAREIPLEHIMIETDAPYLTPEPHRGERNEPSYVKHVAEKIAELKGISFDEVAEVTTRNAERFFNLS